MKHPLSQASITVWLLLYSIANSIAQSPAPPAFGPFPTKLESQHLPNLVQLHQRVFSGGLPEGPPAFQELVERGIKTIITVDGAAPDVDSAKQLGLRYVHLPHGYNGIPAQRVQELAKAVSELEGPIYIHCHHGKHRSPAAAAVACVSAGLIPTTVAADVLKIAGTDPNYHGLIKAVSEARPMPFEQLRQLRVTFQESIELPPLTQAMVALEEAHERVKLIAANSWRTPATDNSLDPVHEVLMLREQFTELLRSPVCQQQAEEFQQWLSSSEQAALKLHANLQAWQASSAPTPPASLDRWVKQITDNCKACHVRFRDNPN